MTENIKLENPEHLPNIENPHEEEEEEYSSNSNSSEEKNEESYEIKVIIKENAEIFKIEEDNSDEDENTDIQNSIEYSVRIGFIKKVYGILSIQLIITFSFVLLFQIPKIKNLVLNSLQISANILILSSILFFFLFLILACCRTLSKTVPYNYMFLFAITLCQAVSCSIVSSCYSFQVVAISLFLTIITTVSITLYSCTTKTDFCYLKLLLLVTFAQLFTVGFISVLFRMKIIYMIYTFLSTITVGIYLVYDTQLIVGKLGFAYSIDDYIFATLEIYMDIIRLFFLILRIVAQISYKKH